MMEEIVKEACKRALRLYIGEQLKRARVNAGLLQKDLEAMTGVNYTTISKIEAGKLDFRINTLAVLGNALGLDIMVDLPKMITKASPAQVEWLMVNQYLEVVKEINTTGKAVRTFTETLADDMINRVVALWSDRHPGEALEIETQDAGDANVIVTFKKGSEKA